MEINSFNRRIMVMWTLFFYISTDLDVIMCIYQLNVPAPKHLFLFVGWISGDIQYLTNLKGKI